MDIVVANAGFVERRTLEEAAPEHFDKTFNINARGAFFTVQKALPFLRKGGSIVLVSSGLQLKGFPAHGAYSATKAAMRSFARTWAAELKDRGIRVNTLSPGPIDTPIIDGQFATKEDADEAKALCASITPLGRIGRAEEMASAALSLASDDGSFSTGIDLVADGGITQVWPIERFPCSGLEHADPARTPPSLARRRASDTARRHTQEWTRSEACSTILRPNLKRDCVSVSLALNDGVQSGLPEDGVDSRCWNSWL